MGGFYFTEMGILKFDIACCIVHVEEAGRGDPVDIPHASPISML